MKITIEGSNWSEIENRGILKENNMFWIYKGMYIFVTCSPFSLVYYVNKEVRPPPNACRSSLAEWFHLSSLYPPLTVFMRPVLAVNSISPRSLAHACTSSFLHVLANLTHHYFILVHACCPELWQTACTILHRRLRPDHNLEQAQKSLLQEKGVPCTPTVLSAVPLLSSGWCLSTPSTLPSEYYPIPHPMALLTFFLKKTDSLTLTW